MMDSDVIINGDTIPDYSTLYVCSLVGFRKKQIFLYIVIQILAPSFNVENDKTVPQENTGL